MGEKSPRGPKTFLEAAHFGGTLSKVVEVTFDQGIVLPCDVEYANSPNGRWRLLVG